MQISVKTWNEYVIRLSRLNQKAGQLMREYIDAHGTADTDDLVAYAYGLVTKYGEGSAELACQMYEALAEAQGVHVPAAEPAATASYGEVARMVSATKDQNPATLPNGVSRLVKRAGADATLKNAIRDGAEWAWVPHGDTCPFCITLASNGWQKASQKLLKGGHAEHIHANCDCEFAVRFRSDTTVAGYDPDKYYRQYREAGGDINKMRRIDYAARKDAINAQKRAAYAARKSLNTTRAFGLIDVKSEYLTSAVPGAGSIEQDANYDPVRHADEIKTAQWLHENLGGDIVLLNETNNYKAMTPDYLWNRKMWDLKTVSTEKSANSAVRHGLKQIQENPGGIILNYEQNKISVELLKDILQKRLNASATQDVDIVVLANDELLTVQRFIAKK